MSSESFHWTQKDSDTCTIFFNSRVSYYFFECQYLNTTIKGPTCFSILSTYSQVSCSVSLQEVISTSYIQISSHLITLSLSHTQKHTFKDFHASMVLLISQITSQLRRCCVRPRKSSLMRRTTVDRWCFWARNGLGNFIFGHAKPLMY